MLRLDDENYVRVIVDDVVYNGGTLAIGRGTTEDGRRVTFAGEPRMLYAIAEAIRYGEHPEALVPTYALLGGEA